MSGSEDPGTARSGGVSEPLGGRLRRPHRTPLVLLFFALAGGILLLGFVYHRQQRQGIREQVTERLDAIARLKVGQLDEWRRERMEDGLVVSRNPFVLDAVARHLRSPTPSSQKMICAWLSSLALRQDYRSVILLDAEGRMRMAVGRGSASSASYSPQVAAQAIQVLRRGEVAMLDFHMSREMTAPHLGLLVPFGSAGVLLCQIDPGVFLFPLLQSWPVPSQTAETLLVRREGDQVLYLNELRHRKGTALALRFPLNSPRLAAAMAARGTEGVVEGEDYRGIPALAALHRVPNSPWFLVAKVDSAEVFAPLRKQTPRAILATVGLVLLTGLALAFWWKLRQAEYYERLYLAEQGGRESEARYRLLFERMSEGMAVHELVRDPHGHAVDYRILEVNPSFERQTGLSRPAVEGRTATEAYGLPAHIERYARVAETGEPETFEDHFVPLDRHFEISVYSPAKGRFVTVFSDVTERKQAEELIRQRDALISVAGKMAKIGGWEFDPRTGKGTWTDEVARIHDVDPERGSDMEFGLSFFHGESRARIEVAVREAIERGTPYDLELELVSATGRKKWVRTVGQAVREDGVVVKVHGMIHDISERRLSEEAIRKLNAELEQRVTDRTAQLAAANKELESFAYSVSHDLRTPLRGVDGFSKVLLEDCGAELGSTAREHLNRIRAATQRMGLLIDDLLKLSRVSRVEMHYARVDLSTLALELAEELRRGDPARAVEWVIAPDLVARADPGLARILLENLLGNAWKFSSRHPKARIEFGSLPAGGGEGNGAMNVFFVRDDGAGFDMAYADKLFSPFQRLHSSREFEGSGIGLANVQRIVHRHGGRVWAEGAVEKGATFFFTMNGGGTPL